MTRRRSVIVGACTLALVATAGVARKRPPADWTALIRPRDRAKLRDWRSTWLAAVANARANGYAAQVAAAGSLLDPDAGTLAADVPDGAYRCRLVRVGAAQVGAGSYAETPFAPCRIAAGRFALLGGQLRPMGRLWRYDATRQVFLGSVALVDETRALDYGRDPDRDAAGMLERIGPTRWRLVLPRPQWQSMLDVIEIVPAVSPPPS